MPKIPAFKHAEDVLKKMGFQIVRISGSHHQFSNGIITITIPKHGNKEISVGVFGETVKKLKISRDEFWEIWRS